MSDLIVDELARLRPGLPLPTPDEHTRLRDTWVADEPGLGSMPAGDRAAPAPARSLGLDSLELLDLATALDERFGPAPGPTFEPLGHAAGAPEPDSRRGTPGFGDALLAGRSVGDWADAVLAARAADDSRIAFFTSGSTGTPKRAEHAMEALRRELEHWARQLADRRRVLRAVPSHHIYGFLFGLMLPARLGVEVVDVRGQLPADVLRRAASGDLIVGHPGFFSLATRGSGQTAGNLVALVSTAPCAAAVWAGLRSIGVERVLEIYGASECGGIGSRWSGEAPFELLPWWRRVVGPDGALGSVDGLRGPCTTPDTLVWTEDGRFRLLGRRDGAVQVGGRNVFPEQVRSVLLLHPEVADAAVRLFSAGSEQRLKAFVVPAEPGVDGAAFRQRLLAWLAERLPPQERPRRIDLGAELPTTPGGKRRDW